MIHKKDIAIQTQLKNTLLFVLQFFFSKNWEEKIANYYNYLKLCPIDYLYKKYHDDRVIHKKDIAIQIWLNNTLFTLKLNTAVRKFWLFKGKPLKYIIFIFKKER